MDPNPVTSEMWHDISVYLRFLWLYVLFILGFVVCFLTAHAFIPSLASTGLASQRISKLRPLLYIMAAGSLLIALLFFVLMQSSLGWIPDRYNRWWV